MRGRPDPISQNELEFISTALNEGLRIDGRAPYDFRELSVTFRGLGHAEAAIGSTRCMCSVSAEIVEPPPERPNAGMLQLYCELSPMAAPEFRVGRSSDRAVEIGQILERGLKQSKAVDTEALCILAGRKVWSIRLDVHILDNQGNMVDCANLAAIAALRHFKKPEVVVTGEEVRVFTIEERQPAPLSILHSPLSVTIAFIQTGQEEGDVLVAVDPLLREEEASVGSLTITQNSNRELCAMQKLGGVALPVSTLLKCNEIAAVKVAEMSAFLQRILEEDAQQRTKVPTGRNKREFKEVEEEAPAPMLVDAPAAPTEQPNQPVVAKKPKEEAVAANPEAEPAPSEADELQPVAAASTKPKKKLQAPEELSGATSPGLDLSTALKKKPKKKKR